MNSSKYHVLLIGSGLMTPPLINYLSKFPDTHISIASNLIEDAKRLASKNPQNLSAEFLDIEDEEGLERLA
jgi:alpha-aminoadipic semialdehyde synthase